MAFEHKDNTGSLFKNDKEGNDKRPDFTGSAKIDGVVYKVASWVNNAPDDSIRISLKFDKKEESSEI
jgi:acylphosphatase